MEITKREVIASITIIAVMMILGFFISGKIDAWQIQRNSEYYTALQITDPEQFRYGMDTSVGNAFVYGTLQAVDPVTYPEIGGDYLYVEKVEEHYNMHTRIVRSGKTTVTQVYYTWDYFDSESIHSQKIQFLGTEMAYEKIRMPDDQYVDTIQESSHVRFQYYTVPTECEGTIYTDLRNGTISDDSRFFLDTDIENAVEQLTSSRTWIFWIAWIILIGAAVFGFYYLDNDWLNR